LETSLILYLDENLVTEPVEDFLPHLGREYLDYMGMKKVSPTGVWGRPSLASRELGEELFKKMLERTDEYIRGAFSLFDEQPATEEGRGDKERGRHGESPRPRTLLSPHRSFYESPAEDQKSDTLDWTRSYREIAERKPDIALVTLAAIEQHSHHLPLGTDFFSGVVRSRHLAEEIGAYLLPPLPVVTSWSHTGFRGTLTLRSLTARRLIIDVVSSLYEDGFRKVAVMVAHGGNWIAKPTVVELNRKYPDLKLVYTGGDPLSYRGQARVDGVHCGPGETAFIMDYYPECLKRPIKDFSVRAPASYMDYVGMRGVSPTGVWGFPSKAKKGMGFQSVQNSVRRMSEYIQNTLDIMET
jgi:creatinine amidohydrolase